MAAPPTFNSLNYARNGGMWHPQTGTAWDMSSYLVSPYDPSTSDAALNPFATTANGDLTIGAFTAPGGIDTGVIDGDPNITGELTTQGSFDQTYGVFQMTAELPKTPGILSAFWLLPADGSWPPELDFEINSNDPTFLIMTAHGDNAPPQGYATVPADVGFHTYTFNWTASTITWYFDGTVVYQASTPTNMNKSMYMIMDTMTGTPDAWDAPPPVGPFSDRLTVQSVEAFAASTPNPPVSVGSSTVSADQIAASSKGGMEFIYNTDHHYSVVDNFNPQIDVLDFMNTSESFSHLIISRADDGHAVLESDHNIINLVGVSPDSLNVSNTLFNVSHN